MTSKGESTRERILDAAENLVMERGFSGTSIDDILAATGMTKGAFFHHFKGKADLARALVDRHVERDVGLFGRLLAEAEAASDDPLDQAILFLKGFEGFVSGITEQPPGCMYAVYTYESMQFDASIRDLVSDALRRWTSTYVRKFQDVIDLYEPALPVTARELGEGIASAIEGGFVLARAYDDRRLTARQSEQFRNYLMLLFGERKRARPTRAPREKAYA